MTPQFGIVEFDAGEVLIFDQGLFEQPRNRQWLLFADACHRQLYWMQSISNSRLAVPVIEAQAVDPNYQIAVPAEVISGLRFSADESLMVLVPVLNQSTEIIMMDWNRPILVCAGSNRGRQLWNEQYQPTRWMTTAPSSSLQKCA